MADVLTKAELNRATLARQMLLARAEVTTVEAVERLLAMQAQEARPPFIGLWSRVAGFRAERLHDALHRRDVVRATHVRGTLHLMSARDYLAFRMPIQPMLTASAASISKRIGGVQPDPERLTPAARAVLKAGPANFTTIRERLQEYFPQVDDRALGYATRMHLPLVMVATKDQWAFPAVPDFTPADTWLGRAPAPGGSLEPLVLRYLAAYGPASVADMRTWSGLSKLQPVFAALRPRLRVFRNEDGQELFDLPNAPRPGVEIETPARFLPEFDSLLLAHSDRGRLVTAKHRPRLVSKNGRVFATFLWDGFVRGTWKVTRHKDSPMLTLTPFESLPVRAVTELTREAYKLLGFLKPDAVKRDVRIDPIA